MDTHSQKYWNTILFVPVEQQFAVWRNPTNPKSLRLTPLGFKLASKKVTAYPIKLQDKIIPKHMLMLERAVTVPYFIPKLTDIVVFDQTVATMLTLHAGDLDTYLSNLSKYG